MEAMGGTAPDLMAAAFLSMQPPAMVVSFARFVSLAAIAEVLFKSSFSVSAMYVS